MRGPFYGMPILTLSKWRGRLLRLRYRRVWYAQRGKRIYIFRWPPR